MKNDNENDPGQTETAEDISRRQFLSNVCYGLGGLSAVIVGAPVAAFLISPLVKTQPPEWKAVGAISSFKIGQTVEVTFEDASPLPWSGVSAKTAAWLRRVSDDRFVAFAVNCTHLGCPVRWLPTANLFMCPCHGGVYYSDGNVAAGPPPRRLTEYRVRLQDGQVQIETSAVPITTG